MKVLLDENMPVAFCEEIPTHDCHHVVSLGWAGTKNGALLALAESEDFDVFVTLDKGVAFQQPVKDRNLALIVLKQSGQGRKALSLLSDRLNRTIVESKRGDIKFVG
ncbi:hypothetical protein BH11ARM1_BH11ARM1_07000 [soil metagenome]